MTAAVNEPETEIGMDEDDGDDEGPELDEALDPELGETEFEVVFDLEGEQREIHEIDESLGIYEEPAE
jgi:hypothetical protein